HAKRADCHHTPIGYEPERFAPLERVRDHCHSGHMTGTDRAREVDPACAFAADRIAARAAEVVDDCAAIGDDHRIRCSQVEIGMARRTEPYRELATCEPRSDVD